MSPRLNTEKKKSGASSSVDKPARQTVMRDRKTQWARHHISDVAVRLFEEKGFAATTVDEIAAAADYSTSTFFRLFRDKEDVIFYDFSERTEELKAIFASPNHGNAWDTMRNASIEFADRYRDDEVSIRRARLYHNEPALYARYLAICAEWDDQIARLVSAEFGGDPKQDLLCQVIAGACTLAYRAAWRTKLANNSLAFPGCVHDAFDKLEALGLFFRTLPAATKKRPLAKSRKTRAT